MPKNSKILTGIAIAAVILWGGYAVYRNRQTEPVKPIKLGVATLLSGDFAALGENIVNTAQLAIEEINGEGGINGRLLELIIEDSRLNSRDGLTAVSKLVNVDGVKFIIGGISSNGMLAAAPLVNQKKVVVFYPVTGGTNIDNAGEYIFRVANADLLAGRAIANAITNLGHEKVAVVVEITEYTQDLKRGLKNQLAKSGKAFVLEENFQPGNKDFRSIIAKLKDMNPEAVFVASQTGLSGGYFVKQAKELGLKATIFSDFTLVTNEDARKLAGSFEGVYFADPAYDARKLEFQAFIAHYRGRYGRDPFIPFHMAATYDSVQILARALREVGDDSEKVHDWLLANVNDWDGFMGRFSFDEKGNSNNGFIIKVVKGDKFVEVR